AMGKALTEYMPQSVSWFEVRGGFFYWLKLPENITGRELFKLALEKKVAFVTGNSFFPVDSDGDHYIRMSFSKTPPEDIEKGVKILANIIKEYQ
ncbi:MAG: hypothetical protein ACOC1N_04765, partial [Bacillota bacterium]